MRRARALHESLEWTPQRGDSRTVAKTAQKAANVAHYSAVVLGTFGEVETALTNEELLAERLRYDQEALGDRTEAVRIARIRYTSGASDLLTVLILQAAQIESQSNVIKLRNAQLANRINLHLALGGGFDAAPATSPGAVMSAVPVDLGSG
jgi:outer membrane protein TolC